MTRLFIRVITQSGSRTVITSDLTQRDATEIANSLMEDGIEARVAEEATPINMKALIRRRRREEAMVAASIPQPANVVSLEKGRNNDRGRSTVSG